MSLSKKQKKSLKNILKFWDNFGPVLKEGLYGAPNENKPALLELARFRSTKRDSLISLKDYIGEMKEGQTTIYYITGENLESIRELPSFGRLCCKKY